MTVFTNIELSFTDEEITSYLEKEGYTVEKFTSWYSQNVYHNDVECYDKKILIAYKTKPDESQLKQEYTRVLALCGAREIFKRKLTEKLKSFSISL